MSVCAYRHVKGEKRSLPTLDVISFPFPEKGERSGKLMATAFHKHR